MKYWKRCVYDNKFEIDNTGERKYHGVFYDQVTVFYDKDMKVEAEYFYWKGKCNYLLSWGFDAESLGELRKRKSKNSKKPFFSLERGWYDYEEVNS